MFVFLITDLSVASWILAEVGTNYTHHIRTLAVNSVSDVCVCVRVYTNLLYFFVCSHLACEDDCGEVAHLLIDHGARLDIQNNASVIFLSLLYGLQPCHCHISLPFWLWLLIGRMYLVRWNLY